MPRTALFLALACLAACSRSPTPDEPTRAGDSAGAAPSTTTGGAAPGEANPDTGAGNGNALARRFLDAKGQDTEACFDGLPVLDGRTAGADLRAPGAPADATPRRVVVAIDASGSMAGRAGGATKMQAAKDAAARFVRDLPADVDAGLVAFGHAGSNREADRGASCATVDVVLPPAGGSRAGIDAALAGFDAIGWTPLASAIARAGDALGPAAEGEMQAVYVVSDGEDTCGGDPVAAARALHDGGTRAIVDVIGFDLAASDRAQLQAVAAAGGGRFVEVRADQAARLGEELQRANRNFSERLRASNATAGRTLRNSNLTAGATLKLENCVAGLNLRESNAAFAWARGEQLDAGDAAALQSAIQARHAAFDARVAAYTAQADDARDATNTRLQDAQDAIDRASDDGSR